MSDYIDFGASFSITQKDITKKMQKLGIEGNWMACSTLHFCESGKSDCYFELEGRVRAEIKNPISFQFIIGLLDKNYEMHFAQRFQCIPMDVEVSYGSYSAIETVWKNNVIFSVPFDSCPVLNVLSNRLLIRLLFCSYVAIPIFKSLRSVYTCTTVSHSAYKATFDDYKKLFESGKHADAIICLNEEEIPVHQLILSARSPVFEKMFENDWKEKNNKRVVITDMALPVLREFLSYIYSGEVVDMTWEMAQGLYFASDKYEVLGLRNICSEFFQSSITVNNACSTLVLAYKYCDDALMLSAKQFILNNIANVIQTNDWKKFLLHNSHLLSQIYEVR